MDKLKTYGTLAIILILSLGWISSCIIKDKEAKQALKKQEQNYEAILSDWKQKNDTTTVGKVVEATPKEIVESPVFNELSPELQRKTEELAKEKALLAALEARLELITKKMDTMSYQLTNAVITDSSVIFPKGDQIVFEDTVGEYQYREVITFNDSITRDFEGTLELHPSFKFTRNRDRSIDGSVTFGAIESSQIKVKDVVAFYIPATDRVIKHPKFHKAWVKIRPYAKGVGIITLAGLTGYAGFRAGLSIP